MRLIDKQRAIEAMSNVTVLDKSAARRILTQLPAIPEQRWIPVTERLPNKQEEVIVSYHDTLGDMSFDYTAPGWITPDGEYWIVDNEINNYVVAWMPLPEPYKGENR